MKPNGFKALLALLNNISCCSLIINLVQNDYSHELGYVKLEFVCVPDRIIQSVFEANFGSNRLYC